MNEPVKIASFQISGIQIRDPVPLERSGTVVEVDNGPGTLSAAKHSSHAREYVQALNRMADEMAEDLEREVRRQLPVRPFLSVRAELRFSEGSVELAGYLVITWIGTLIWNEAKSSAEELVRTATSRVVNGTIRMLYDRLDAALDPIEVHAAAGDFPNAAAEATRSTQASATAASAPTAIGALDAQADGRRIVRLQIGMAVLATLVAVLLLDRIFELPPLMTGQAGMPAAQVDAQEPAAR